MLKILLRRYIKFTRGLSGACKTLYYLSITAAVIIFSVIVTEILMKFNIGVSSLTMFYLLSVLLISFLTPDYLYGIIAAAVSTFLCDYYISAPRKMFSYTLGSPITLITMLFAALLTSALTERVKTQARLARERERRWRMILQINEKLLTVRDADTIIDHAIENIRAHLAPRTVEFYAGDPLADAGAGGKGDGTAGAGGDAAGVGAAGGGGRIGGAMSGGGDAAGAGAMSGGAAAVEAEKFELLRIHRIFSHPEEKDCNAPEVNPGEIFYYPAVTDGIVHGVTAVDCAGRPLSASDESYLSIITGQLSLALGLQRMSDVQSRTLVDSEKQKVRSALLRMVFNDLRPPISRVIEAAARLGRGADTEAAGAIEGDARRLLRMVDNILAVTKLSEDSAAVKKAPEAADEIVSSAIGEIGRRYPDILIHTRKTGERLIVPMDATLISRVLINLLENAARASAERGMILVDIQMRPPYARFEISDEGRGFPEDIADRIFEADAPGRDAFVDTVDGIGLGLSMCRTVVRAHGGVIEGGNREEGGAKIVFKLPL